jgi:hypothetical protein
VFFLIILSPLTDVSRPPFFSPLYDVTEDDGHRFPIPVPDVDERFREIPEKDPYGMIGIIPGNASR